MTQEEQDERLVLRLLAKANGTTVAQMKTLVDDGFFCDDVVAQPIDLVADLEEAFARPLPTTGWFDRVARGRIQASSRHRYIRPYERQVALNMVRGQRLSEWVREVETLGPTKSTI